MPSFSWRGVTTQLFVLVVLPLSALLLIIAFGGLSLHRQAMRTMVGERDERAVRAAASAISEQLNHREKAIHGLALLAEDGNSLSDLQAILTTSVYLLPDFDLGLAFFERGGELLAFSGESTFWETLNPTASPLQEALVRDIPPTFLSIRHPQTGEIVILTFAVSTKGGPIAVGGFDPVSLARRALAGVFVGEAGSIIYLVDASNGLLNQSGTPSVLEAAKTHPGIQEALAGNSGTNYVLIPGGEHALESQAVELGRGNHERADLIGATLDIQAAPGNGTRIGITLMEK